ncbi:MAG: glutamate--tRNA ligase [Rickettsiales bacterium]
MTIITRFAPSPTGFLHIGGARTALFNWLYAKHNGGKFYLRIEDTDRARSTQPAIDAIIESMKWLGLDWDGEIVYQFARTSRHAEIAHAMVENGKAFYCYTTQTELEEFRAKNPNAKFRSPYRNGDKIAPNSVPAVIRLKAPIEGEITINDKVQGVVSVKNSELDDMILLRSDGTPTYMLAVVVDDHDMGITQIIRGDDHHTNSFRQLLIYQAMGWQAPEFAHIPLIHGADGAKLSKRHGALGVGEYEKMGYLPEALRNYLLRLGWSHGDDEIISTQQAIEWFDLDSVGKSPSRFDFAKLENLNGHYMRESDDARLVDLIFPIICHPQAGGNIEHRSILLKSMNGLKQRAKTIIELADNAAFYVTQRPMQLDEKAKAIIDKGGREIIAGILPELEKCSDWTHDNLQQLCKDYGEKIGQKLGNIAQPLRCAICGKTTSPSMFEVMEILGKEETIGRLEDVC